MKEVTNIFELFKVKRNSNETGKLPFGNLAKFGNGNRMSLIDILVNAAEQNNMNNTNNKEE